MANQSQMLRLLRNLYMPQPRNGLELAERAKACAAYWQTLTPPQRNAVALLNRDATLWKAAWDSAIHAAVAVVRNGEQADEHQDLMLDA